MSEEKREALPQQQVVQVIPISNRAIEILDTIFRSVISEAEKGKDGVLKEIVGEVSTSLFNISQNLGMSETIPPSSLIPPTIAGDWMKMAALQLVNFIEHIMARLDERLNNALIAYIESPTDTNWENLVRLFDAVTSFTKSIPNIINITLRRLLAIAYSNAPAELKPGIVRWIGGFDLLGGAPPME